MFGLTRFLRGGGGPAAPAQMWQPDLPFDLTAADVVSDPAPLYAWARANAPVAELAGGGFLLTRHADVKAALTDPRLGNAPSRFSTLAPRNAEKYVAADLARRIPPFLDDDAHRAARQMTSRAFFNTFNRFDGVLDALAVDHARLVADQGDVIAIAAQPFALRVMAAFCGLSGDGARLKPLTQAFFHLFAPLRDPRGFAAVNEALTDFRMVIADSLDAGPPAGSFLAELSAWTAAQGDKGRQDIIDTCLLVFADGVENIEAGAASLLALFDRENVLESVAAGTVPLAAAIREGLRLETPAQFVPRVAKEAFEMHGVAVGKDMPVFLALASANRDDAVFPSADRFDAARDVCDVMTFGQGRHRCIGEPLAIAQLTALLRALLDCGLRPVAGQSITYHSRLGHRWPVSLQVSR